MNEIVFLCVCALSATFYFCRRLVLKPKALQCRERGSFVLERLKALKAFSLVEMLMALLVASLLLAALAPVMTKKFNEGSLNISGVNHKPSSGSSSCTVEEFNNNECSVPGDAKTINILIASGGGGGGAGVIGDYSSSSHTISGNVLNIDSTIQNVVVELTGGGGGGGGGNGSSSGTGAPTSQADCEPFGVYVTAAQNGGKAVCVSKYNPANGGDGKATPKSNVSGVTNVNVGTSCSGGNCCWNGATSTTCQSSGNGFTYSGCNRTVCQWNAANTICQNWKPTGTTAGRLPTQAELAAWAPHIKNVSSTKSGVLNQPNGSFPGLQLCDGSSSASYGALQCRYLSGGCPGSSDNYCYPYYVWSGTPSGSNYYNYYLHSGSFNQHSHVGTRARGVRCVLESTSSFSPFSGGGGGGGAYMKVRVPDDVLARASQNGTVGKLTMSAGNGGHAGAKESPGSYGGTGGYSVASVTDSAGVEIWRVEVPGGAGGKGATTTAGGSAGAGGNANTSCRYKNILKSGYTNTVTIGCTSTVLNGENQGATNGESGLAGGEGTNSGKGKGGRAAGLSGLLGSQAAVGQTSTESNVNVNGSNGGTAGAGGGGGNGRKVNGATLYGTGGAGLAGSYRGTYNKVALCGGAGGGGGGAGALLHIKNLDAYDYRNKVIPKPVIGKGGAGAAPGTVSGTNGGYSSVTLTNKSNNTVTFRVEGGTGGRSATRCVPTATPVTPAVGGAAGTSGGVNSATQGWLKDNISQPQNRPVLTVKTNPTAGGANPVAGNTALYYDFAMGGNGAIVDVIGAFVSYPCGSFSNLPDGVCKGEENASAPYVMQQEHIPPTDWDAIIVQGGNYQIGGSSGGAGGGWKKEGGTNGTGTATQGSKGLDGFAYVYFGFD